LAHVKGGFVAVTTNNELIFFNVTEIKESRTGFETNKIASVSFCYLMAQNNTTEIPQLVYEPMNNYIYIIFEE
jgi:hypothetical protein